jgi:hypothetical protein
MIMRRFLFGIVGGGWRSEAYLRIARELPDRFGVSGIVVRDAAKGAHMEQQWGLPTYRTLEEMAGKTTPDFVVACVPWPVTPTVIRWCASCEMPVLAETPPAPDNAALDALLAEIPSTAKVQVAEQYPFQPHLAAAIAVAQGGKLGEISQVQLSVAHGYHGVAIMRKLLGIRCAPAAIDGFAFSTPLVNGPDRDGAPREETIIDSSQTMNSVRFGNKIAILDFTGDQYFSWIRSQRLLVRGERGEINNEEVRYLRDFRTPMRARFLRDNAGENGNLEGYWLKGIQLAGEWVYRNPFVGARLCDDELAMATCLHKMGNYTQGGESFYSLAEGAYDHYLGNLIDESAQQGKQIAAPVPAWMR